MRKKKNGLGSTKIMTRTKQTEAKFRFGENVKNKQIVLGVKKYDLGKTNWGWDSD